MPYRPGLAWERLHHSYIESIKEAEGSWRVNRHENRHASQGKRKKIVLFCSYNHVGDIARENEAEIADVMAGEKIAKSALL